MGNGGMGDEVAEMDGILIPENLISYYDNLEYLNIIYLFGCAGP